ncbi:MAG TPA: IclR family transcriptional regulator [Roseiflexaceae bacterium]|nr:IclR family transcriptional regulator [Roseiflexaceae bacterium]
MDTDIQTRGSVKSAARVIDIFELLASHADGLSLSEICVALRIPKSSGHALLNTLTERGYLREGLRERSYRLGPAIFEIGSSYMAQTDLVADGQVIVRETARACDETVHLAVLYIAKEEGTGAIRMVSAVGLRFPAHGTGVGKVLLADLDEAELAQHFPADHPLQQLTPATITDPLQLRHELAAIHSRGYAFDREESTPGLCCIAAPVYRAGGRVVAAMSIAVPTVRFTEARRDLLRELLLKQTHRLSFILGHR